MATKRKAWDSAISSLGAAAVGGGKREPKGKRETRRRVNARRWIATSDADDLRRKMEARLESLEGATALEDEAEDGGDEWNDDEPGEGKGRKVKAKAAKKMKSSAPASAVSSTAALSKRYRARSLAQFLLDDHAAQGGGALDTPCYVSAEGAPSRSSAQHTCVMTGLPARYRDPSSGLSFANKSAQTQLKETPPPWLQSSGNAPYFEAVRFIRAAGATSS
jgi:hypothetical protein